LEKALTELRDETAKDLRDRERANRREVKELRKDAGEYKRAASSLTQSNRRLGKTLTALRKQATKDLHIEERAKAVHETAGRVLRAKDEFVDSVINDLRTPLVSIIGISDSILQKAHGDFGNERYEEYVGNMHNQATHLLELVDQALSKAEQEGPANAIGHETGGTEADTTSALIDPGYAVALAHYAGFSARTGNDQKLANALFQRAITADPGNAVILSNYSLFRSTIREDHERVDALYRQFLDADPDNVTLMLGHGVFLSDICKKHDRAEEAFRHAIVTAPNHARGLGIYAGFLTRIREDFERAGTLYRDALDADPDDADLLSDYARFLWKIRNDTTRADELYQRAIAAKPAAGKLRLAYVAFLLFIGRQDQGMEMLLQIVPDLWGEELLQAWFYQYAYGRHDTERAEGLKQLRELLERKVRSPSFDPTDDVRYIVDAGHPEPELLDILGRVIGGRENFDVLDRYQAWRAFETMKPRSPKPPAKSKQARKTKKKKERKKKTARKPVSK
jgi:Tfp pilus assembly protein PilF